MAELMVPKERQEERYVLKPKLLTSIGTMTMALAMAVTARPFTKFNFMLFIQQPHLAYQRFDKSECQSSNLKQGIIRREAITLGSL